VDTTDCDREPIHVPGRIQPHGALLVLDGPDGVVLQVGANVGTLLGVDAEAALGRPLGAILGAQAARALAPGLAAAPAGTRPALLGTVVPDGSGRPFHALAHRADGGLVLELEAVPGGGAAAEAVAVAAEDLHALVDGFTVAAEAAASVPALAARIAEATRRLTGFDRVLVYRFDEGWNGTVIGEDGNGRLPSLLDHRFPASDVPAPARDLYRVNRLRIIPDAGYRPVPLVPEANPRTGGPLDLTFSVLRSVSPVHLEYMRNMGTAASMSVSILRGGALWGLVSCHHAGPRAVPYPARAACDLFARAFSLRLQALEHAEEYERRIEVRSAYARLLAVMTDRLDVAAALAENPRELLALAGAEGAAVLTEGGCLTFGAAPGEAQVRDLAAWLFRHAREDVWGTDALPAEYPPAAAYRDRACGVLAAAISKLHPSYVLWFRPEVVRTIKWGGDPNKARAADGAERLHPRTSFATWLETVRDRARPWAPADREGAAELRHMLVGTVLRKAEELAALNAELTRSNKELEAFSYSVSHDLRAPLRHIVGYAEMLREGAGAKLSEREAHYVATIIDSSEYAGRLVDKLLAFSRLGRAVLQPVAIDANALVRELRADVMRDADGREIAWTVGALPVVHADLMMLRMALRDLLSNAVKYTRGRDRAAIEVGAFDEGPNHVLYVRDNGVGFDMKYVDKLFGVFQRLHRWEDFEGTGIGLANVRRVVERHGGRTWAEGEEGRGATFYLSLPKPPPPAGAAPC
jgi:light-regulated signal transduction histidine kinase (bacteriophytochrome)